MNRLANATSPYLRQHADNPVDWQAWSPEAFAEAKSRDVPVHLSIGYAACHWCHVMARESFSDPATADHLNRDFVSIKVDREERPDVDQVYMRALHALGEQGGWPLTMFLTPDAEPFWGGTYFPPEPRWGRPSFRQVLAAVSAAWKARDAAIAQNAAALKAHLQERTRPVGQPPDLDTIDRAAHTILSVWDMQHGSFKGAPKFPNPVALDVLWRAWLRTGDSAFQGAVLVTLTSLCQGGVYDHLGGGFARYAVDAGWIVPHFEKMLYDNGLLLSALSYAYRATHAELFRTRIEETVDWLLREMRLPGGAFASSLDADTDHEEGLTYTWSWAELQDLLGRKIDIFAAAYDATPHGNWEGKIILNRLASRSEGRTFDEAELARMRSILLARRAERPQPARDDKVLADWNGLAISGLVQTHRATGSAKGLAAAQAAFAFVSESMADGDRLAHSSLRGACVIPGLATDYANMIAAALDLFAVDGEHRYLERATRWFAAAEKQHFDAESGAYRLSPYDGEKLIATAASHTDEATPAATGVMARNAARLFMLTGGQAYRTGAETMFARLGGGAERDVVGSASLQSAYDESLRGRLAFLVGIPDRRLLTVALDEADPAFTIVVADTNMIPPTHPAYGKRPAQESAVFLCDATRCLPEVSDPCELETRLQQTRKGLF
jgi:uncharacterized protein YyaL (SSP411 family)